METFQEIGRILESPFANGREWSLQGLGMLRTYLDAERVRRLHVWSDQAKYEGVSELHTHPWDMTSTVIAGEIVQKRYVPSAEIAPTHMRQRILCGEHGGLCGAPTKIGLREMTPESYSYGEKYSQLWWEVHSSHPLDGTVTLVERKFTSDPDHADVFWPIGQKWVTAEPRPATREEVSNAVNKALEIWF